MIERLDTALEGRYRVARKLGEGVMATVYLAEDLKHRRNVALKVLKPELAAAVGGDRLLLSGRYPGCGRGPQLPGHPPGRRPVPAVHPRGRRGVRRHLLAPDRPLDHRADGATGRPQ